MADKTVTISMGEGLSICLSSDSPDIKALVKLISDNRDSIDVEQITVSSTNASFDETSFKEVIHDLVLDYLKEIELDTQKYREALSNI